MNNLTTKEINAIFLVHNKADYRNINQIKESLKIIEQRKILQSAKALRYKKRLALLCRGKEDYSCVFCKEKNPGGKGVICPDCENLLNRLLEGQSVDENEIKAKIKNRKTAAAGKALNMSRGFAILAIALSVLMLGGSIFLFFSSQKTYDDLYEKALLIPEFVIQEKTAGAKPVESDGEELFGYVGMPIDSLPVTLGSPESIISDNIKYYGDANVSVLYNVNTSLIEYIDIDGVGQTKATLMGISYGMTKEEAMNYLASLGVTEPSRTEDTVYFYEFVTEDESSSVEFAVTYVDDKVVLLSATGR